MTIEKLTLGLRLFCSILLAALSGAALAYGNGSSFSRADASKVNYAYSPFRSAVKCDSLIGAGDPQLSIISAELITATAQTPKHCLIYALISPEIQLVIQLPSHWNGRLYVHGNGGDAGESVYSDYGAAVRQRAVALGFVATFSNTGHARADFEGSRWAYNSVQREIDYSYRALHLNAVVAKALIERYYGRLASHSYFDGCSTGGGQGLRAAQRFPTDFDGIVAGAPVFDPVTLLLYVWNNQNAQRSMQFDPGRLDYLGGWIMQTYDGIDGLEDGVISNPAAIDFDPVRDLPRDPRGKKGFTKTEIEGLALAYGGLEIDGRRIAPGVPLGAENAGLKYEERSFAPVPPSSAWLERILPDAGGMVTMQMVLRDWLRYVLFEVDDPTRDWQTLDIGTILPALAAKARILSVNEPDLRAFESRGGKLIIYNGWGDVGVNPYFALDYYRKLRAVSDGTLQDFARLFLVPGMFHCRGGLNVDRFDAMTALIDWVEGARAPDAIDALRLEDGQVTRRRPLCAYPQVATYRGSGDLDAAESFGCRAPAR